MNHYCIYHDPKDYPGKFVVRRWVVGPGTMKADKDPLVVADSLEEARGSVPEGMVCLTREEGDDPAVAEVWI